MLDTELINDLNRSWDLELSQHLTLEELVRILAQQFNRMIKDDFSTLVQLLYRIDVSEKKLRTLLQSAEGQDAGAIIARLVIERQYEKIETRRRYKQNKNDIPDDERW